LSSFIKAAFYFVGCVNANLDIGTLLIGAEGARLLQEAPRNRLRKAKRLELQSTDHINTAI
jgi:hypothetical protein